MPDSSDLRNYLHKLRNIGIIAHIDAGKTTLTERILYYTSKIHRMGEVHEGAAAMDFMPEEQDRGITIASACCTCSWRDYFINLIDTPGHVDFSIEVERCLRVLDGAVGVFCAVGGVEPQSEAVWRQAEHFGIPKLAFVNKLDRPGASFSRTLEELRDILGARPVALSMPLGEEDRFEAVIDLLSMERLDFAAQGQGREFTRRPLNEFEASLAAPWREALLEAAADEDDLLMEQYLAGTEPSLEVLKPALRRATLGRRAVPVYAGAALRNMGVQPLLDGILDFLPGPAEAASFEISMPGKTMNSLRVEADPDASLAALVFKIFLENGRKLALLRIYAGQISEGMACRNNTRDQAERVTRLFRLEAENRMSLPRAGAGDIVAAQGLRSVITGDTITSGTSSLLLENILAYRPVISMAFEPRNNGEGEKLDEALERYTLEDPTLKVEVDENSGQRIVSGMGELHLEVLRDRLRREYRLEIRAGNPQVVCRESVRQSVEAEGLFDRELGDITHYGQVRLRVSPLERGKGNKIVNLAAGTGCPASWPAAVEQGVETGLDSGVLRGFPVQDVLVEILELGRREGVSSPVGYHMAAVAAVKSALESASPMLLEPIMHVEISVPESFLGAVLNLLASRGAKVENVLDKGGQKYIRALAPLREFFGFSTRLRSSTQGRAGLLMRFERFDAI
ncbi:MAG: elongation factor G [Desulfovibrionaceae bacterium]|nr:elongation factor G [Desulfovibrionaceae bacterium]